MKELLIIIPAYNEAENIEDVVKQLTEACSGTDYIVVNDGSLDETAAICKRNGFNLLDLPVNLGLSGAVRSGMRYAYSKGYKYAMQFDGDGQHDPRFIAGMLSAMKTSNADIVIGSRFKNIKKPFSVRMLGSKLLEMFINLGSRVKLSDVTSGMRLYNDRMIKRFAYEMNYIPEPDTLSYLIRHGAIVNEIQVEMSERTSGESYLNVHAAIRYMIQMLFSIIVFEKFRGAIKE